MKIAIAGYGVEGKANFDYWSQDPDNRITIVDQKEIPKDSLPSGAATIFGDDAFLKLEGFDRVIRTASLPPRNIKTDGEIWSATNEFFVQCPAPIIGVTGTKGKGTTSSMIASILEKAGKKVWLVGNIGIPALSVLPDIQPNDVVVFELSSFQLWDIQRSPHIAVVLPVEAEHLDVHADFDDYIQAKAHITAYQTKDDICIYQATNEISMRIGTSNKLVRQLPYAKMLPGAVYYENNAFKQDSQQLFDTSVVSLKGEHNKENACAAITVAQQFGVDTQVISEGLRDFQGLPHRLEYVRTLDGVEYYNDSFSSSPPATLAAAQAFSQPEILIIGGINRGGDFSHLANQLSQVASLKKVILIGEYRHELQRIFTEQGLQEKVHLSNATTMQAIVSESRRFVEPGDVIILSPGCASFDLFNNFSDRGEQFKKVVESL